MCDDDDVDLRDTRAESVRNIRSNGASVRGGAQGHIHSHRQREQKALINTVRQMQRGEEKDGKTQIQDEKDNEKKERKEEEIGWGRGRRERGRERRHRDRQTDRQTGRQTE